MVLLLTVSTRIRRRSIMPSRSPVHGFINVVTSIESVSSAACAGAGTGSSGSVAVRVTLDCGGASSPQLESATRAINTVRASDLIFMGRAWTERRTETWSVTRIVWCQYRQAQQVPDLQTHKAIEQGIEPALRNAKGVACRNGSRGGRPLNPLRVI